MGKHRMITIRTAMGILRYCNVTPATIRELANYLGRTPPDINSTVKDMVEMGILKEAGKIKTTGTRPAQRYEYNRDYKW